MARIVQSLTQPLQEYDQQIQQTILRDIEGIVNTLNSTSQHNWTEEVEASNFYIN